MDTGLHLLPNEQALRSVLARSYSPVPPSWNLFSAAGGRLYLTTLRLTWKRSWFNVPYWGPRSFGINLADIKKHLVHGRTLAVSTDLGEYRFLLVMQRLWRPMFWYSKRTAEEWRDAISAVLAGGPIG